jgi:hypothetical protein
VRYSFYMSDPPTESDGLHEGNALAKYASPSKATGWFILVFLLSLTLAVFLQKRSGSHDTELSEYPDEPAHYVSGLMVRSYLHQGHWESPTRFAEEYYLHYPKVAIGHWPPIYYLAQFVWTLVFPATISSISYLQAVLLAVTSAILFTIAKRRSGVELALILCGAFLILRPTQELGSEIMSEPLLALTTLAATWSIARYFETARSAALIGFVVLVEVAAHTKGSGIVLAGVPVLLGVCIGRRDVLRKRSFWLAQLIMIVVLLPWQIFTFKMLSNGTDGPLSLRLVLVQAREFGPIMVNMFGWPLLVLILSGGFIVIVSRRHRDPLLVSCAVTAALTLAFHCVSPSGAEDRRLFMAIPEALILTPLPFLYLAQPRQRRPWPTVLLLIIVASSLLSTRLAFRKAAVGYRQSAGWLLANANRGENAVLIASDIDGEGMLISEIGQREPKPSLYIVRSSKLFEDCDWQGRDCRPIITDPSRAEQVLDSMPVRYVVIDRFSGLASAARNEVLRRMLGEHSDLWVLRNTESAIAPGVGNRGEILIYQRVGLSQSDQVHVRVNLNRMIGRAIGK